MLMGTSDITMPTPPTPASCAFYQDRSGEGGQQCAMSATTIFAIPGRLIYRATGFELGNTNDFGVTWGVVNIVGWLLIFAAVRKIGGGH